MFKHKWFIIVAALALSVMFAVPVSAHDAGVIDGVTPGIPATADISGVLTRDDGTGHVYVGIALYGQPNDSVSYIVYFDTKPPKFEPNIDCIDTSDFTSTRLGNNPNPGPGVFGAPFLRSNGKWGLELTVHYTELGVVAGDHLAIWVETQRNGNTKDRAPNTDDSDRCPLPQNDGEVLSHHLLS